MTVAMSHARPRSAARAAPLGRLLRSELTWVLRRPRTLAAFGVLGALPVLIGVGVALSGGPDGPQEGPPLLVSVAGNGPVLAIAALSIAQVMLLPLVTAMVAADALAGEAAHGTLRNLLIAPVGRARLVLVKAAGVGTVIVLGVGLISVTGTLTGLVLFGGADLVTLSGTSLPPGESQLRVAVAAGWVAVQMAGIGAVALAVSSATEHPLLVLAATLGGIVVFGLLAAIPSLNWLEPLLLTSGFGAVGDVLRDPMPSRDLLAGVWRAACYVLIGLSVTLARTMTKDT